MQDFLAILTSLAWPFAITVAWLVGEFGQRWTGLPRISFYGLVGFVLAAPSWACCRSRRPARRCCWPTSRSG